MNKTGDDGDLGYGCSDLCDLDNATRDVEINGQGILL